MMMRTFALLLFFFTLGGWTRVEGQDLKISPLLKIHSIGAGSLAGVYFPVARGLGEIWRDNELGYFFVKSTQGSLHNLHLLFQGKADLALVQSDVAFREFNRFVAGTADFTEIRAIASLYSEHLYFIVSRRSGIDSIAPLEGKTLSLGGRQSGTCRLVLPLIDFLGINLNSCQPVFLTLEESISALEKGEIDGFFFVGGDKIESIQKLGQRLPVQILPLPFDTMDRLVRNFPYLSVGIIPRRHYPFLTSAINTVSVRALLLCRGEASSEWVESLLRTFFTEKDRLIRYIPAISAMTPRDAQAGIPIPLHPGAEGFFRGLGAVGIGSASFSLSK